MLIVTVQPRNELPGCEIGTGVYLPDVGIGITRLSDTLYKVQYAVQGKTFFFSADNAIQLLDKMGV